MVSGTSEYFEKLFFQALFLCHEVGGHYSFLEEEFVEIFAAESIPHGNMKLSVFAIDTGCSRKLSKQCIKIHDVSHDLNGLSILAYAIHGSGVDKISSSQHA